MYHQILLRSPRLHRLDCSAMAVDSSVVPRLHTVARRRRNFQHNLDTPCHFVGLYRLAEKEELDSNLEKLAKEVLQMEQGLYQKQARNADYTHMRSLMHRNVEYTEVALGNHFQFARM